MSIAKSCTWQLKSSVVMKRRWKLGRNGSRRFGKGSFPVFHSERRRLSTRRRRCETFLTANCSINKQKFSSASPAATIASWLAGPEFICCAPSRNVLCVLSCADQFSRQAADECLRGSERRKGAGDDYQIGSDPRVVL